MNMHIRTLVLACGALALPAAAQTGVSGSFDRPLSAAEVQGQGQPGNVVMEMSQSENGRTVTVRNENGKLTAKLDGKKIPASRIRQNGNTITVVDESGNTLSTFTMPTVSGSRGGVIELSPRMEGHTLHVEPRLHELHGLGGGELPMALTITEPPRVMVGITMSEPEARDLEQLGVEPGAAIRVDAVIDGLPASEAGLREGDIIIAIDGDGPASQERLREILRAKEPGDDLRLRIVRTGGTKEIRVLLVAFEQGRLPGGGGGGPVTIMPFEGFQNFHQPDGMQWRGFVADSERWAENLAKHLEEAAQSLRNDPELQPEVIREKALGALDEALRHLREHGNAHADQLQELINRSRGGHGGQGQSRTVPGEPRMMLEGNGDRFFVTPTVPSAPSTPRGPAMNEDRLERLLQKLERLDERLGAIEERLDKAEKN